MHRNSTLGVLAFCLLLLLSSQSMRAAPPAQANDTLIRLQRATFDPLADDTPTALQATSRSDLYLVQFNGPVQTSWKVVAQQAGARLYGYIPDYAFIARIDRGALARVQALPFVRWVGVYQPAYRLAASLTSVTTGTAALLVQTLPDADLATLRRQIANLSGTVLGQSSTQMAGYLRVRLPAARTAALAALDGVVWVEVEQPKQLLNEIAAGQIMRANQVRQDLGLFGAGQIVAVADTGLDVGKQATIHADFKGRVLKTYCLGRPTPCDWSDFDGHGTHVSGSVLGSGALSGSQPALHQYGGSQAGVAPEAQLVMQSIMDSNGSLNGIPGDAGDLMRQAYGDGARIHSNSWGGPTGGSGHFPEYGGYVISSQQVDQVAWEHKDMLILFSAGNSGADFDANGVVDPDSIGQPGTAKNSLTIGASENLRPGQNDNCTWGACFNDFTADPIASDPVSNNANGLAAFSSRGPTDDGRIKPDLVAPGTNIVSARSHQSGAGTGWGVYDDNYMYDGGTSMATPLTAGAAAVAREWLTRVRGVSNPSAALIKSLLVNGAADMSPGQYGTGATQEVPSQRPNIVTGWGRVDLGEALDPASPRAIWLADDQHGLGTAATARYVVTALASGPLRLTLSWTDYPGEPTAARTLVNDLDLELIAPDGTHYRGNQGVYSTGQCLRAGQWDACNTIEGISIPQAQPGNYTIIVHAAQVAQGGTQPFALVASGTFPRLFLPVIKR